MVANVPAIVECHLVDDGHPGLDDIEYVQGILHPALVALDVPHPLHYVGGVVDVQLELLADESELDGSESLPYSSKYLQIPHIAFKPGGDGCVDFSDALDDRL